MEVKDVLRRLQHLGLEIRPGGNHWKVYHPSTGVWLFDVSKTPSDANWHFNIRRHLRRIGLSWDVVKRKGGKQSIAVDLVALKRAQDQAAAAGEHIPTLADLDEAPPTSPLWKRRHYTTKQRFLTDAAEKESLPNMAPKADSRRTELSRARLRKLLEEKGPELEAAARERSPKLAKGKGAKAEFVRIAIDEVAPNRGIQTWKSAASGQQSLSKFLEQDGHSGLTLWALTLIDATMDHIEGLKWGIDETRKKPTISDDELVDRWDGTSPESRREAEKELKVEEVEEAPVVVNVYAEKTSIKERYAEVLMNILETRTDLHVDMMMDIMSRLDKLVLDESNT